MRNRQWISVPLLVILGAAFGLMVFLLPSMTAAQPPEEVRSEIEKTDRILDLARKMVVELDVDDVDETLSRATKLQREARDALDLGEPQRAMRLTHEARRRAQRAMGSETPGLDNSRTVERELRKTDQLLDGARAWTGRRGTPPLKRRLGDLGGRQKRAWSLHREHRQRHAMRMTLRVRDELENLRRHGGEETPFRYRFQHRQGERLEHEVARMEKALQRLSAMVNGDNPRTREQLQVAQDAHQAAVAALHDGDTRRARMQLREGHHALGAVLSNVADNLREQDFSNLIEDARRRLDTVTGNVGGDPDPEIRRMLEAAASSLTKAQKAYDADRRRQALLHMHRALNLLDQVEAAIVP